MWIPRSRRWIAASAVRGITLFEVAVSQAILALAVISVVVVFPVGVKAQQLARARTFACVAAMNMMDAWTQNPHEFCDVQVEAEKLGMRMDSMDVDLEGVIESRTFDLVPLPDELGRRFDSDGDEIARILDQGGQLYYPRIATNRIATLNGYDPRLTEDAQRVVFAIVGYAQQNGLGNHPCYAWPYYDQFPTVPEPWEWQDWQIADHGNPWPAWNEFNALYQVFNGQMFHTVDPTKIDAALAQRYLDAAKALVVALAIPTTTTPSGPVPTPPNALPATWTATDADAFPKPWNIWAISHLAHAAMLQTAAQVLSASGADPTAARAYAVACHDSCLRWAMRYASCNPYDWGAPRPFNRQTAWDFPLLQVDLFPGGAYPEPTPLANGDVAWRIVAPWSTGTDMNPANYGRARGVYGWAHIWDWNATTQGWNQQIPDNRLQIQGSWGDPAHFNLLAPFSAAERTRQLVCWLVDWQSYEDFETLPASQRDSRRAFVDSTGRQVTTEGTFGAQHPERDFFWHLDPATGARTIAPQPDYGQITDYRPVIETDGYKNDWSGIDGADRNGNGVLDRGPVPRSARLRATLVARFNYYDQRLMMAPRN